MLTVKGRVLLSVTLVLGAGFGCGVAPAQALRLDAVGGSTPGTLALDLYPGLYPMELAAVVPAFTRGPMPLAPFFPGDPRALDVGSELLSATWFGFLGLDGHFRIGPNAMPSLPQLQDLAIFFQAVTIQGSPPPIDRISNANAIRLGIAGTFRDRIVTFQDNRAFASALPRADGTWMVAGGASGALLAQLAHRSTAIYDPLTDLCAPGPMLTTERSMHTQTQLSGGRWLFAGGVNLTNDPQASCEIYDPVADTFTAVAGMNEPRMGHTATLLPDGRVFVAGGLHAMTVTPTALSALHDATDTAEIYDPVTDSWTLTPDLRTPRAAHAAILRPDGKVLLAGGISWNTIIIIGWLPTVRSSCDLYDPVTNTMVAGPAMVGPRSFVAPLALGNDKWLLAGGIAALSLTNPGTATTAAEIYDAVANTWTPTGAMANARAFHSGWALGNGEFLLAGGAAGTILLPVPAADSERFSLQSGSFAPGPSLTIPRAAPAMIRSPQGQIHLFGGGSTNNTITNSTEFYYF